MLEGSPSYLRWTPSVLAWLRGCMAARLWSWKKARELDSPPGRLCRSRAGREHAGWKLKAGELWTSAAVYLWPA